MEWHTHYPNRTGIYKCRVDHDRTTFLVNHQCVINRHFRWQTLGGKDVDPKHYIEWTGESVGVMDIEPEDVQWFEG